jgi:V8-like Glu-specific endopeptidase
MRGSLLMAAAMLAAAVVTGCSSPVTTNKPEQANQGPATYWTPARLLAARAWRAGATAAGPAASASPKARTALEAPRIGALFLRESSGNHFCTASVVTSPGRDLLITAAHCLNAGHDAGYRSDIVFIPDYRDGRAPYGIWTPARLLVAPGWASRADPDLDVGFVVLKPRNGENIEQVLGANVLSFDAGYRNLVRVTGYPQSSGEPITCRNYTTRQSKDQLRFGCAGFTGGTSGSPWITGFDPATHTGRIVGVLGGYQQGGDTDSISYSAYLGPAISQLYQEAKRAGG